MKPLLTLTALVAAAFSLCSCSALGGMGDTVNRAVQSLGRSVGNVGGAVAR